LRSAEIREAFLERRTSGSASVAGLTGAARRLDLSANGASCALGVLEDAILGYRRTGDVPGAEIPSRYFHYARSGDARPLVPVLEHNRLDLVSLAAVASVIARMLHEGAPAARNAHECLALGRLYEQAGAAARASACFERAIEGDAAVASWQGDPAVQRQALRHLAVRYRRERRHEDAATTWQRIVDDGDDLEALHALAVYHEHRSKNLVAARALVLRALNTPLSAQAQDALRHRLGRIDRKLGHPARSTPRPGCLDRRHSD
jgi:tetratricopeptide (TPR) repeat protein